MMEVSPATKAAGSPYAPPSPKGGRNARTPSQDGVFSLYSQNWPIAMAEYDMDLSSTVTANDQKQR